MRPHARTANATFRTHGAALVAVAITVTWHAALVGWLSTTVPRARQAGSSTAGMDAIDIVFVPRRRARRPAPDAAKPPLHRAAAVPRIAPATPSSRSATAEIDAGLPAPAEAAHVEAVAGDDRWSPSPAAHEHGFAPRNPLVRGDRHALDVAPRLRVRMRPPRSVESWLKLLAPTGYEADPCPELARAIAGLAADAAPSSRALLDDAVQFEATHCR